MARLRLGLTTGVIGLGIAPAIIGGVGCSAILGDFTVDNGAVDAGPDVISNEAGDVFVLDGSPDAHDGSPTDAPKDTAPPITCDAGLTACGTACISTQSDTANCGGCGHDCLLGKCSSGVCQGYIVVQPPNTQEFTTAATDGTSIIYGDMGNGIVAQIPVGGGNPILLANKGPEGGIAIGGGKVAFVPNGSSDLYLATIGQANSAVLSRASFDNGGNQAIAMDPSGAKQFIVNQDNPGVSYFIYFCNAVQCSTLANVKSASLPGQMAANATNLYWTDPGTSVVSTYSFQTTQMTTFASGQNKPNLVAIDSTYVYWVTGVPSIVRMKQAPGGALETVVALVPSAVEGMTTDGKYVYYGVNGHVFYAPVGGGGTPVPIYAQPGDFYGFTTAGGFVSWIGNNFNVYGARTPL
jgi:hypothetical protein